MSRSDDTRRRADARLEDALDSDGLVDPRPYFRDRLRLLKERDASSFERALRYFEDDLVPRVADPEHDPVEEWVAYGALLAQLTAAGPILAIDGSGRASAPAPHVPRDSLLLHLPDDPAVPALPLSAPRSPTPPQRATWELLVAGRVS